MTVADMNIAADMVDVMSDGTIIAALAATVKKSTDGGANWADIYTIPGSPTMCYRVFVDSRDYIFVSGYGGASDYGLYRSVDAGATWTTSLAMDDHCVVWGMDEDASGNLFIGEYSSDDVGTMQVWKSIDGGENWVQKYVTTKDLAGEEHHVHDLRIDPTNGYIYFTTGDETPEELWRSTDGGETWFDVYDDGGTHYRLLAIEFHGGYVYVGTDIGANEIYRFQDDGTAAAQTFETVYTLNASYNGYIFSSCKDSKGSIYFGAYYFGASAPTYLGLYKWDGNSMSLIHYIAGGNPAGYFGMSRHNGRGKMYVGCGAGRNGLVLTA